MASKLSQHRMSEVAFLHKFIIRYIHYKTYLYHWRNSNSSHSQLPPFTPGGQTEPSSAPVPHSTRLGRPLPSNRVQSLPDLSSDISCTCALGLPQISKSNGNKANPPTRRSPFLSSDPMTAAHTGAMA